ncbi:helix-turn-helix domain-containing protein [Sulfitobacter sp. M22]|uniref:helix-turn-helix domain-containing protein n=1 Tax=Sulfitobacter sp. M22 TaxID=2675332 RepID=UPI001F35FE1F|nr:helix-turn-helix domain-containing protein [Sulfitobacter sp. M22]MCF7728669.1 hypothetical protein [Sulfitobacter sp. M22]
MKNQSADKMKQAISAGLSEHMRNNAITAATAVRYHCDGITAGQMSRILNNRHAGLSIEMILKVAADLCVACSMKVSDETGRVCHPFLEEKALLSIKAENPVYQMKKNLAVSIKSRLKDRGLSQTKAVSDNIVSCTRNDLNRIVNLKFDGHSLAKIVEIARELGLSTEMVVNVPGPKTEVDNIVYALAGLNQLEEISV